MMATSSVYNTALFGGLSGRSPSSTDRADEDHPLIVALHGGTFSSLYYDVPGYSLFARAGQLGLPVFAPDRPGYGESPALGSQEHVLRGNATVLREAIGKGWLQHKGSARGIVLVGHSIGAAIAMLVASETPDWPLLGIVLSGVGLQPPERSRVASATLPDAPKFLIPSEAKDRMMFGPPASFDARMPAASHIADTTVPRAELVEIVMRWPEEVREVATRITIPVHYRQAQHDALWVVSPREVRDFAAAFTASPLVDAAMVPGVGHCIDFHRPGHGVQLQQIGFALQCAGLDAIGR